MVEGVGLVLTGEEENYLVLIDGRGEQRTVSMSDLVPTDGTILWSHFEALTDGFGTELSERKRREYTAAGYATPRAYRLRITVEAEPLTHAETEALLAKARAANSRVE